MLILIFVSYTFSEFVEIFFSFTGRGGSDGSKIPRIIDKLKDEFVISVYCGVHFSLALTKDGKVFSWGKGDGWRLGHATDEHVRFPKQIDSLQGTYRSTYITRYHIYAYVPYKLATDCYVTCISGILDVY